MDKVRWYQMKNGMQDAGWRCVVEMHPELPKHMADAIAKDTQVNYPGTKYDRQWYRSHNGYLVLFAREKAPVKPDVTENQYREPIIERLDNQTLKGIDKYGTVLPQNKEPLPNRIEHVQQELTDALVYNEWIAEGLTELSLSVAELQTLLHHTADRVRGWSDTDATRREIELAAGMINTIARGLGKIGKSE